MVSQLSPMRDFDGRNCRCRLGMRRSRLLLQLLLLESSVSFFAIVNAQSPVSSETPSLPFVPCSLASSSYAPSFLADPGRNLPCQASWVGIQVGILLLFSAGQGDFQAGSPVPKPKPIPGPGSMRPGGPPRRPMPAVPRT
jgi:hypothetical protein